MDTEIISVNSNSKLLTYYRSQNPIKKRLMSSDYTKTNKFLRMDNFRLKSAFNNVRRGDVLLN